MSRAIMATALFDRFAAFATNFSESHPGNPVDGANYGFPARIVFHQTIHTLAGGGSIEVNTITPRTPQEFAWQVEITLNHKASGEFIHVLLQRDGEVVETYGKTILPINEHRAEEILAALEQLTN